MESKSGTKGAEQLCVCVCVCVHGVCDISKLKTIHTVYIILAVQVVECCVSYI